jgi:soluble lytic murein transglycosylase-like protein
VRIRLITKFAATLLALSAGVAEAAVFEVGEDGRYERIDVVMARPDARSTGRGAATAANPARQAGYRPIVANAGERYALSPALIDAIAHLESRYNQRAVSTAGAIGIMQLMPRTARAVGVNPRDAAANIHGGTAYLRYLLNRYDGDIVCTIAAYNAGPAHVTKSRCIPDFPETRMYVAKVLDHLAKTAD